MKIRCFRKRYWELNGELNEINEILKKFQIFREIKVVDKTEKP